MKTINLVWILVVVLGMSIGQILFKLSGRWLAESPTVIRGLLSPYLLLGLVLYGAITIVWIWQLSFVDLSRAYPVMAMSFVVVPILSALLFGDVLGVYYWLGIGFIIAGVLIVQLGR
jgi:drug/metabolite transporter (DMT)-like permease